MRLVLAVVDLLNEHDDSHDEGQTEAALPLLAQLLTGKPLGEEHWSAKKWEEVQHIWRPAMPNSLGVGDPVRVKMDGYSEDDPMSAINGREGVVSGIRHGVLVAFFEDAYGPAGPEMGVRIETERLEQKLMINRDAEMEI